MPYSIIEFRPEFTTQISILSLTKPDYHKAHPAISKPTNIIIISVTNTVFLKSDHPHVLLRVSS